MSKFGNQPPFPWGGVGGRLVFATNNQHKLQEVRHILGNQIEVLSLKDIGCHADIPETGSTLEENARQKAEYVWQHYHCSVFADDTGLEVEALGGAPGVYSARYAAMEPREAPPSVPEGATIVHSHTSRSNEAPSGAVGGAVSHDSEANMARLLRELGEKNNRRARFRTVIALILKRDVCPCGCTSIKEEHLFEGIVDGEITRQRSGSEGFGYDPIFRPDGYDKTFAELGADIKDSISHRARATQRLCEFLRASH